MNETRTATLFGDNMVLQQGIRNPVWGWAQPGQKVVVSLAGKSARGKARKDGRGLVKLPALPAGGPHEMTIAAERVLTLKNVMIGEVWLASGQSNMEWPLNASKDAEAEVRAANFPAIRMFKVAPVASVEPKADVQGRWDVCSTATAEAFSAVGYLVPTA